jgi:putative ABC transport system permease protein
MTVQLMLVGYVLTYLFKNPYPLFTLLYFTMMLTFAVRRVFSQKVQLNNKFKISIALSFLLTSIAVPIFFIVIVTEQSFLNPQYTIPIAGMLMGNSMTGFNLALKAFQENLKNNKDSIHCLLMLGVHPKKILMPHINSSFETALIPTINSMLSMGIISLPGMLTGQILAGALPNTAILYQISIMIAICATVCISVFCGLYFGQKFLYNEKMQLTID